MNSEKQLSLKDIPMGNRVEIVGYANIDKEYRQKLFSLGLIRGETLKVTKKAPLGDPIEVCLNGSKVSLRKEEATELIVELREPCGRHGHGRGHHHHGSDENRKKGFCWGRFFHK